MIELIFLKIPGVKCFLSEKLRRDPIESFFENQRMCGNSNDNTDVTSFVQGTVSIFAQGSVSLQSLQGNITVKAQS